MTSDCAQTFLNRMIKKKSRESGIGCSSVRVRQVVVKAPVVQTSQTTDKGHSNSRGNQSSQLTKPPPLCFVCNDSVSIHFLGVCETFKIFANERKKRVVVGAGRCLNCLSLGHMVRNCMAPSRRRRCGPACSSKHVGELHELYVQSRVGSGNGSSGLSKVTQPIVGKLAPNKNNTVLLRTSAVRVINPSTGRSTLVCAQHKLHHRLH